MNITLSIVAKCDMHTKNIKAPLKSSKSILVPVEELDTFLLDDRLGGIFNCLIKGSSHSLENFKCSNLLFYDIDREFSILEACDLLEKLNINYFIATSKNHQKAKGEEPPCDRFHIFIPFKTYVTDIKRYRDIFYYVLEKLEKISKKNIREKIDKQASKAVQFSVIHSGIYKKELGKVFLDSKKIPNYVDPATIIENIKKYKTIISPQKQQDSNPVNQQQRNNAGSIIVTQSNTVESGDGGDKKTFAMACRLIGLGCDYGVFQEFNYTKCRPNWKEDQLRHKWECAGKQVKEIKNGNYIRKILGIK